MSRTQRQAPAERITVTAESVRDALADLGAVRRHGSELPIAHGSSAHYLAEKLIGHDPSLGRTSANYGGKSKDGYFNEWLSMAALRRTLAEMVAGGSVVEVDADDPAITANYRAKSKQYLLKEAYDESVYMRSVEAQEKQRRALLNEARQEILRRHEDEVLAEARRLCADAGLPFEEPAEIVALRAARKGA